MKKNRIHILICLFFLKIFIICAQNGPGGVGSSTTNGLWLKADSFTTFGVLSSWADTSGNGNNAGQSNASLRPISIATSALNGMPIVRFDGNDDEMVVPDADILDNTSGISYFVVLRPNNLDNAPRGILGKRLNFNTSANYSYTWFMHSNRYLNLDVQTQNDRFNTSPTAFSNAINYILSFTFDGSLASSQRSKIYSEMNLLKTSSESSSSIINGTADLAIGALNVGYGQYLGADYAEIIQYNYTVTEVQRIIINNYLSAKYNIALSANDFYTQDTSGENFDFKVAGIGRASNSSSHTDSKGSGIVRINTPSDLNNDEYLFWGENVKNATYSFPTTSNYKQILDTKWRVSKRNDLGTVSVSINASDLDFGSNTPCLVELIVDNNSDFSSPKNTYKLMLSGGVYTATGVSFANSDYFTLAYATQIVFDGTTAYNGSGTLNKPNTSDGCFKLLVKSTTLELTETANVREVEVETGAKLVINAALGLTVTDNIQMNGNIRLINNSQLVQTHSSTSKITGTGKLYVDQNSDVTSLYLYNYFSSPVVTVGQSTYTVASVMKDGTTVTSASSNPPSISFVSGLDGSFASSPIEIPNRWIYTYDDVGAGIYAYNNNGGVGSTQTIAPGKGYLFKGPGRAQNYTFVGTPNDGEYSYSGIPSGVNILIGNPYPSAFNIQKFLTDNFSIGTTAYLWQQVGVANSIDIKGHYSSGYIGGYATINSSTSTEATALTESNFVLEAENSTLGGNAAIVGDKVALTTATDSIKFKFNGLSKSVDSLFIVYSADASKNIDIDVNNISVLTSVNLPSTSGILDTLKVELSIIPIDSVLLKSKDANTSSIDKVFGKQKFSYTAPPFNYLTIGQGFFFNTDTPGTMVFNNSQRAFVPEGTGGSFFFKEQKKNNDLPVIKLGMDYHPLPTETYHRQLAVSFKQGNSFDYDRGFDSEMSERGVTDFYWKFLNDDKYYVIAGVQEIDEDLEVPLEVIINDSQEIEIKIDELQNINRPIYLKDAATNTSYNLNNSNAKIQLETGLYSNRFYLAFKESSLTIKDEFLINDFIIQHYRDSKKLLIKNNGNSSIDKVTLYNVLGQKIIEVDDAFQLNRKKISIKTNSLSSAIYIVTIKTSEGIISKKFF